ncbi:MAG: hypothetical protein ORO02_00650 [Bacteroidia bacterium]|nr:hypothetical protein [Bacteroidia bacterium]
MNTNSENQNRQESRPHNRLWAKKQAQRLIEGLCFEVRFFAKTEKVICHFLAAINQYKMNKLWIIIILTISVSCDNKKTNSATIQQTEKQLTKAEFLVIETAILDKLKQHFEAHKIKPSVQINNTEGNQTDIQLANHKIKWFDKDDETKIKIDNDLFTLKDKVTLNNVSYGKVSVDFSNNWDEIKLFKHNNREYIGIRMSFAPCVGLGCSVDFFLIYDVKTKTKNFFGTFRTDRELELFNYGNDEKIDFVAKTHNGSANGSTPIEYIYELYSMDTNGQFKVQKDSSGLTYQIKHTFFPNDTTKADKLTEHWITKIK